MSCGSRFSSRLCGTDTASRRWVDSNRHLLLGETVGEAVALACFALLFFGDGDRRVTHSQASRA